MSRSSFLWSTGQRFRWGGGIFVLGLFSGCSFEEEDILGAYAAEGYVKTADTIVIRSGGIYDRFVYAASGEPVLRMHGRYELVDGDRLTFHSFFFNLDRDLLMYPELLHDTAGGMSVIIEHRNGTAGFCTGYLENENCYHRVDD